MQHEPDNRSPTPEPPEPAVSPQDTPLHHPRDFTLTRREARAGGPADMSVTGEEDPGAGLEFLVQKERP